MDKQYTNFFDASSHTTDLNLDQLKFQQNYCAFRSSIPSLLPMLQTTDAPQFGLVQYPNSTQYDCIQYAHETLIYQPLAQQVEHDRVEQFLAKPMQIKWAQGTPDATLPVRSTTQERQPLVILGLGLGFHFEQLIASQQFSHVIIYEPNVELFRHSLYVVNWAHILRFCDERNIQLFFQMGNDGVSAYSDINELHSVSDFTSIALYKHFNSHVFDALVQGLHTQGQAGITPLSLNAIINQYEHDAPPLWQDSTADEWRDIEPTTYQPFIQNMQVMATHFPQLHDLFTTYRPRYWAPLIDGHGQVNCGNQLSGSVLYRRELDAAVDLNLQTFMQHPTKDNLNIGYNLFKHEHYLYHQFTQEVNSTFAQVKTAQSGLPDQVISLIMYGMGLGVQLPKLLARCQISHIFVCESQLDYFYCSLFALDWQAITEHCIEADTTLYLNIGGNGDQLLNDITQQSQKLGMHILAQTYLYKPYYNASLAHLFTELREHLKAQLVMSEHVDHVLYGFAHTDATMRQHIPYMLAASPTRMANHIRDFPVFVVGNGPSLDASIACIKAYQNNAIVISCGTALKALIQHDIIPDYHAEIEQNRACYDWIAQSTTAQQRQHITLISCNGIHPDVVDLFGATRLVAKAGESSTLLFLGKREASQYMFIDHAFPTVSNFAVNFVLSAGFKNIYLLGIDFGFKDKHHHHSKYSAYYKQQQDTSNFIKHSHIAHTLPGNFGGHVQTKYEFKIARRYMQECIANYTAEVFNLGDGAKINGAFALVHDDILLGAEQKHTVVKQVNQDCFATDGLAQFQANYAQLLAKSTDLDVFSVFRMSEQCVSNHADIQLLCKALTVQLFKAYNENKTLSFYLLNGAVHTLCAILLSDISLYSQATYFKQLAHIWDTFLDKIQQHISAFDGLDYDYTNADIHTRTAVVVQQILKEQSIALLCDRSFEHQLERLLSLPTTAHCIKHSRINPSQAWLDNVEYHVYIFPEFATDTAVSDGQQWLSDWFTRVQQSSRQQRIVLLMPDTIALPENLYADQPNNVTVVLLAQSYTQQPQPEYSLAYTLRHIGHVLCNSQALALVLMKYYPSSADIEHQDHPLTLPIHGDTPIHIYHTRMLVALSKQSIPTAQRVTANGCRLTPFTGELTMGLLHMAREINAPGCAKFTALTGQ